MNDKVAVITGTSSGLGMAMATTCLERGFLVFGGSRTESPIVHENFIDLELDIRSEKSVINFFSEIAKETEVVDILINNAGICGMDSFSELDSEDFIDHFQTNILGSYNVYKHFEPFIISEETSIFNIQSVSAKFSYPNTASYTMSEFGKKGLVNVILKEWSKYKLRHANFYVGAVNTPLWADYHEIDREKMLSTKDFIYVFESVLDAPEHIQFPEITFLHKDGFLE
jgi:NADP-dependent 3-hydroxy acid dehydrogenase YdfG